MLRLREAQKEGGQTKSKMARGLLQHRECSLAEDRQVSVGEYISPVAGPHGGPSDDFEEREYADDGWMDHK